MYYNILFNFNWREFVVLFFSLFIFILIIIFILLTVSSYAGKYSTTVNAADEYGNTPLSTAIYNENLDMIKLLLNNKMDPNTVTDE